MAGHMASNANSAHHSKGNTIRELETFTHSSKCACIPRGGCLMSVPTITLEARLRALPAYRVFTSIHPLKPQAIFSLSSKNYSVQPYFFNQFVSLQTMQVRTTGLGVDRYEWWNLNSLPLGNPWSSGSPFSSCETLGRYLISLRCT